MESVFLIFGVSEHLSSIYKETKCFDINIVSKKCLDSERGSRAVMTDRLTAERREYVNSRVRKLW